MKNPIDGVLEQIYPDMKREEIMIGNIIQKELHNEKAHP
jgi:hypothetical protein